MVTSVQRYNSGLESWLNVFSYMVIMGSIAGLRSTKSHKYTSSFEQTDKYHKKKLTHTHTHTHLPNRLGENCRINRLHLCRGLDTPPQQGYDTKQLDGEVPVILELWGIQSTPSLTSLSGPLWLTVVALDSVLSLVQIELNYVLMLNWIVWNRTVLTFNCL